MKLTLPLACYLSAVAAAAMAPMAVADDAGPAPVVALGTKLADVKLPCPDGTRALKLTDAAYCVRWPVARGSIPVKHGPGVWYHAGGAISAQGPYRDGKRHGVWTAWDEDGRRVSVISYAAGEYHGRYQTWWPNGARQSEIDWQAGHKHGLARTWGDDGKPLSVVRYDHDKVVSRTDYGPDGKPVK